jgi:hypothetical protein
MTKGILGFLNKKPQGASNGGLSNKIEATLRAVEVGETSNLLLQDHELMVQNPPPSTAIPRLGQGSSAIVEEPCSQPLLFIFVHFQNLV